ncbi:hypothetical protein K438DRAFT_2011829 [Mycena galopus ATCC 62051]|nr:hypothetical protein K438DRAFT_2011829 [Mycena galopus ATCC 62051]
MKPPQSQRPANTSTGSYRRLADIASQPSLFSKTPTLRAMPLATFPSANDKRDSLYGKLPQEDEDSTDSDSSSATSVTVSCFRPPPAALFFLSLFVSPLNSSSPSSSPARSPLLSLHSCLLALSSPQAHSLRVNTSRLILLADFVSSRADLGGLICSGETPCFRPQDPGSSTLKLKTARLQDLKASRLQEACAVDLAR